ncbi:hypothetical protein FACS189485_02090 [Spirochaetia bacterium]|nr:hypothetical protein FACS189485_02090 [Spirochaetia bacterium]
MSDNIAVKVRPYKIRCTSMEFGNTEGNKSSFEKIGNSKPSIWYLTVIYTYLKMSFSKDEIVHTDKYLFLQADRWFDMY